MRSYPLLLNILFAVLLLAQPAAAQTLATRQALDTLRARYHLPALVAAIVQPEAIYYLGGGARRNDQPQETVTLDDYFHLGSETKSVTSLLAGKLVEEGKLKWKSKLLDVVPELKANARPEYADVTLDKLLSHRAGVQPFTTSLEHKALPKLTGTVSERRLRFAAYVLQQPPCSPPKGLAYTYSNAGYVLAALMLEHASGSSWEELVTAAFEPLKLRYLVGFPNRHDVHQPWGHRMQATASGDSVLAPLGPESRYQGHDYMAPAMELSMPLPDFARLVQLHLQGLLGQDNYLKSSTYQIIHFGRPDYSYGWVVGGSAGRGGLVSMHSGTTRTFFSYMVLYPSQRIAFVVLTNAGGNAAKKACHEAAQTLWKRYLLGQL